MLNRLSIRGLRGLRDLTLTEPGRVNLIVGRNDTGKTTLLEAVRLLLTGDPRHMRRPNRSRIERVQTTYEESFGLAFYQGRVESGIRIVGHLGEIEVRATANIESVGREEPLLIDTHDRDEEGDPDESLLQTGNQIVIRVAANNDAFATVTFPFEESALRRAGLSTRRSFEGEPFPEMPTTLWLGTNRAEVWSHARRFSQLADRREAGPLIELLRRIEPRLKDIRVSLAPREAVSAGIATLKIDLQDGPLLPLESMGDGFASSIALVTAVAAATGGLCLIDEIENGIHYSILPSVWTAISDAVESYDTQVWATTHSLDCVAAAHEAFSNRPESLRVHRLSRHERGEVKVHTFDYSMLTRALESGWEVR